MPQIVRTPENVVGFIRTKIREIDDGKLFWVLKTKYRWDSRMRLDYPLACLGIWKAGIPYITTELMTSLVGTEHQTGSVCLHRLSSLRILTHIRQRRHRQLRFIVNPDFLRHMGLVEDETNTVEDSEDEVSGVNDETIQSI